jgi:hypothetical protein
MPSILEAYREERNKARDELRACRREVQSILDAEDLLWREKHKLLSKLWSNGLQAVLARTAPLYEPGMHPSTWEEGFMHGEDSFKMKCSAFAQSMDGVLSNFPASEVPKRKTRKK